MHGGGGAFVHGAMEIHFFKARMKTNLKVYCSMLDTVAEPLNDNLFENKNPISLTYKKSYNVGLRSSCMHHGGYSKERNKLCDTRLWPFHIQLKTTFDHQQLKWGQTTELCSRFYLLPFQTFSKSKIVSSRKMNLVRVPAISHFSHFFKFGRKVCRIEWLVACKKKELCDGIMVAQIDKT